MNNMKDSVPFVGTPREFGELHLDVGNQLAQQIDGLSEARSDLSSKTGDRVWCGVLSTGVVQGVVVEIVANRISETETLLTVSLELETHPQALGWWKQFCAEMERRGKIDMSPKVAPYPPNPGLVGWDKVFDWFYQWQEATGQRMTIKDLAAKIDYEYGYVRKCKAEYDAEHGTE
jgi:hypothetical protein